MSSPRASHVAITVQNLERAEAYYQARFDMEVVTREELRPDGHRQLPRDKGWSDARRAGIELYMVALRRGEFALALFDEASPFIGELGLRAYRPLFIGLNMCRRTRSLASVRALRARIGMKRRAVSEIDTESAGNSAAVPSPARAIASDAG